ncbi:acetyltransferase [Paenibacillus sp. N3.4]|uniref:acetyltransferase n=1 Tax=Paenibacillus sp. N3.4 TaxID=2603222 RepID=UPI0011C910CA|nr:acetyltransferase [Paenibacillus sp. N3.4]TXK82518.1 acetyltransferase [Paenibacillus sp. N3.4]
MDLVLIGEGGHSKVIKDLIGSKHAYNLRAILDDKYEQLKLVGDIYIGPISSVHDLVEQMRSSPKFVIGIGNNRTRKSIAERLGLTRESYTSLIHDSAIVSGSAFIGVGSVIMAHTIVNAGAVIGDHAIINSGAIVEHDAYVGDYVHIAPKSLLTGSVVAGEGAMIGAGATVIPGKKIGEWVTVGAGATVIHDLPSYCTAVGIPARMIARSS